MHGTLRFGTFCRNLVLEIQGFADKEPFRLHETYYDLSGSNLWRNASIALEDGRLNQFANKPGLAGVDHIVDSAAKHDPLRFGRSWWKSES
jgi:hypothetical protein